MDKKLIRYSFIHSSGVLAYVSLVSWLMLTARGLFGKDENLWAPITFLMLLVVSVAIVGSLIFLRPVLWYLDNNKKEAVKLLLATLVCLIVFVVIILILHLVL